MLCVEQGCVHWCLPGSPLQQCGVSQPIPPGFGMSLHSAPGEQLVKGAAGRPKDRLPKAQHGGVPSIGTVWPGGRQALCLVCWDGSGAHPSPGMVPPRTLLQPWPCLMNLLPWLHPAKHTLSWFLEP